MKKILKPMSDIPNQDGFELTVVSSCGNEWETVVRFRDGRYRLILPQIVDYNELVGWF